MIIRARSNVRVAQRVVNGGEDRSGSHRVPRQGRPAPLALVQRAGNEPRRRCDVRVVADGASSKLERAVEGAVHQRDARRTVAQPGPVGPAEVEQGVDEQLPSGTALRHALHQPK
ncbi:mitochondrial inner membrane protein 1 [Babesia caballi]|uniref:Mitochondrial inner membrane protein 1 n=1 Tax=Babesia caballi TaxID=5871 RepID=A0AAV4LRT9_BABCB|nr:mitochondrial inner membrane protein 1 [Babesia caballi]